MDKAHHQDAFIIELQEKINAFLDQRRISRYAGSEMFLKMIFYILIQILLYLITLNAKTSFSFIVLYLSTSLVTILSAINIAHDAAHDVIFKSRKWNYILYYISFQLTGYNPDTWKSNHVKGHHSHPNIQDQDPHFPETVFLRFARWQPWKPYHQFQHFYAIFLYCLHSVIYFLVEEPRIFLGMNHHIKLSNKQLVRGLIGKCIYLFLFIVIPYYATGFSLWTIIGVFVGKHIIISMIMTLVLGINHFTETTAIISKEDKANYSWEKLQLGSTLDFATENRLTYWLIGGFNSHALHHLFPGICHTHYRTLIPIFRETIYKYQIPYQEVPFLSLLRMHFRFLEKMGRQHG